jgi:hypothetical protein
VQGFAELSPHSKKQVVFETNAKKKRVPARAEKGWPRNV